MKITQSHQPYYDKLTLSLILSEACNLNCSYCYIKDKQSKNKLDFQSFLNDFEKIYSNDINYTFDIMGGEPLLQIDLVKQFISYGKRINANINIMTNGLLITEELVQYFNDNNINISISYDGLWQSERGRVFNNERVQLIKKINSLKIHSMFTGKNFNLLENHNFLYNLFEVNPDITLVRDIDTWNEITAIQCTDAIRELFNGYSGEFPNFLMHFLKYILLYHKKGYVKQDCGAGTEILSYHNNKFFSCYRFFEHEELIKTKKDFCKGCSVYEYCEKGCLVQQLENRKPIEHLCYIYKYIYTLLLNNMNKVPIELIRKELQNA